MRGRKGKRREGKEEEEEEEGAASGEPIINVKWTANEEREGSQWMEEIGE